MLFRYTAPSLHRKTYIPVFHFISCLTEHQIQMPKREKSNIFPISNFPLLCTLPKRYLLQLSVLFFPTNMEASKRTTTRIGRLCSSTKKQVKKQKKKYNFMIGSLLFIMTFTRGKNLWPLTQK